MFGLLIVMRSQATEKSGKTRKVRRNTRQNLTQNSCENSLDTLLTALDKVCRPASESSKDKS
jgi:hypothetical protein